MQSIGNGAILYPEREVGAIDLKGSFEATQHWAGVLPDEAVALQFVGVQLILNAAGPGQSHPCPRVKPEREHTATVPLCARKDPAGPSIEVPQGTWLLTRVCSRELPEVGHTDSGTLTQREESKSVWGFIPASIVAAFPAKLCKCNIQLVG